MPTYHEIMTTNLSALTTAADRWDGMAKKFHAQEVAYKRDVYGTATGSSWQGLSANAAKSRFDSTLKEFQNAQVEAKAVASLLRDAHTNFVNLREKLKSARKDAVDADMKVSDQGVVSYDTSKLTQGEHTAMVHDPDYQKSISSAVSSWQQQIDRLVKDVGDADKDVKTALDGVVVDSNIGDGTLNGFNGQAHGDVGTYVKEQKGEARMKTDGWVTDGSLKVTGPAAGFSATGPGYGQEGMLKAYGDLFHVTAQGTATNGPFKLSGIGDVYGGARGTASFGVTNDGISGTAETSAGVRALVEGRAEAKHMGVYARGSGFAGAEAGVNAGAGKNGVHVGAKAFAGAKASGAVGGEIAGIGIGGTAEGWAGAGAEARFGYEKRPDGTYSVGGKAGAADALGGALGLELTFDPKKFSDTVGGAASAVGNAAGGAVHEVGSAVGSAVHGIGGLL